MRGLIATTALLLTLLPQMAAAQQPPAPATPAPAAADWMQYKSPYAGEQTNLANPHRTSDEIISWAQNTVADALSFSPQNFNDELALVRKFFSAKGWAEYAAWVKGVKIDDIVRNQGLGINTVVKNDIKIVNKGSLEGSYRWIVLSPVIISFLNAGGNDTVSASPYNITLQIARSQPADNNPDGLVIDAWSAAPAVQ